MEKGGRYSITRNTQNSSHKRSLHNTEANSFQSCKPNKQPRIEQTGISLSFSPSNQYHNQQPIDLSKPFHLNHNTAQSAIQHNLNQNLTNRTNTTFINTKINTTATYHIPIIVVAHRNRIRGNSTPQRNHTRTPSTSQTDVHDHHNNQANQRPSNGPESNQTQRLDQNQKV